MTTTYCTRLSVESIISAPGLLALIDDDADGVESPAESQYVTDAIERAAARLNAQVGRQYVISELSTNAWMKWANATLAVMFLCKRKGNPLPESVQQDVKEIEDLAIEISWGRRSLPEQAPSFDHSAAVSNFNVEMAHANPIRVNSQESTRAQPVPQVRRNIGSWPYY